MWVNYPKFEMTLTKNTFIGEYSYSLDSKGRINIPSKFRQAMSEDNLETFVITRGLDPCIWVYPLIQWQQIEKDLKSLSSLSKIHRAFVRNTARYATPSTYDKQGRIKLTPSLVEYSFLKKEILIIGMVNKIEIWDPIQLNNVDTNISKINPEEYDALSDKIVL
ncbi:MAG: division/cell wall cluster transcriptional repressor MraZ [Candidatus Marinimicrobia bacterium]|nr:division/cell wall cluster transcriptional repressor MraZ [Candidatus Neomarinimicrobiota bacterium]